MLWRLFPNHPFLLESQFELTESLQREGYVSKPIVGRCGANITLYGQGKGVVAETGGKFDVKDTIYQQLSLLPKLSGHYAQLCSFWVAGSYAGACTRMDPSPVIKSESDIWPLVVVSDKLYGAPK